MPKDSKLKKYEDVLMTAIRFDEDDLAANASGTFSAGQLLAFKNRRAAQTSVVTLLGVIIALIMLLVAVNVANVLLLLLILAVFFIGFALLIGGIPTLQITRDLQQGVRAVEGRVELDMTSSQNGTFYVMKVEGKKFKVMKPTFLAFKNGDPYRIYYAPYTDTILSVEWLRDDNPFEAADTLHLADSFPRAEPTHDGEQREDRR